MFQKSLLKNFVKSFSLPDYQSLYNFVTKDKFIAEDANGAEFIALLAKMLNWTNYSREVKNDTDRKKADGVIYDKDGNPIAIIELKSSDKDISNRDIIAQAFRYKNEKPTCRYVIISNFKRLDIYSDSNETSYSVDLTEAENYKTLYALLNQASLENNEIARLKKISKSQEQITKEVYKEYSDFRLKLLNNLIKNNPNLSKELIFEATNKLLDRFMFILFAEDRGLIPPNSIDTVIKQYESSQEWGDDTPLYEYYKKYFHFIDVGNPKISIPKYNGNLFKPDEILDTLIIDDEVIKDDLSHLSAYDFSDDVDVEVLGHIFEQSINDLEKIKETLIQEHKVADKRKKDGVFYTPKFITEYIISNTIGKLCQNKKDELKLLDESKDNKRAKAKRREALNKYKEYLENLKIVDPACGSGAFLNASFRYLLNEHQWIQKELQLADAGLFEHHDIDKQIIENNLFGVDINSASVGISKLSLWLQTAKRDRALSDLANNIKCANSLLSDWRELFPQIMDNGGFDVVIGNPPYVRQESIKELKPQLKEIYSVYSGTADLFVYFYELAQNISKDSGLNGYICSNKFFRAKYGEKLREMILSKTTIKSIVDFNGVKVFEDATVDSAITILEKGYKDNNIFKVCLKDFDNCFDMSQNDLSKDSFSFVTPQELAIKKKIEKVGTPLKEWDININYGIKTGLNEAFIIDGAKKDELIKLDSKNKEIIKPLLRGRDIKKYEINFADKWIITTFPALHINIDDYPLIKEYLASFGKRLEQSGEKGSRKKTNNKWFETQDQIAYYKEFEKDKIFYSEIGNGIDFCFDNKKFYCNNKLYFITSTNLNLKYAIAIFNSNLYDFYFKLIFNFGGGKGKDSFKKLPILKISEDEQKPFIDLVDKIINSKEKIAKYKKHFDSLNAVDKIEIKEEIEKLENIVNESIEEIDRLIYKLYGLSSDEINIVEGAY